MKINETPVLSIFLGVFVDQYTVPNDKTKNESVYMGSMLEEIMLFSSELSIVELVILNEIPRKSAKKIEKFKLFNTNLINKYKSDLGIIDTSIYL